MTHPHTHDGRDTRPTIEQIEHLLQNIQLIPGSRFRARMKNMPWLRADNPDHHPVTHHILRLNRRLRLWLLATSAALAVLVGLWINPVIQTVTTTILGIEREEVAEPAEPNPSARISLSSENALEAADSAPVIADLSRHVGYTVRAPHYLPDGFERMWYFAVQSSGFVGLAYAGPDGEGLIVNQHNPTFGSTAIVIGTIETGTTQAVTLRSATAEYVTGRWNPAQSFPGDLQQPASAYHLEVALQSGAAVQQLSWTTGDVHFDLYYFGSTLTLADLVAVAESMFE